MVETTDKVLVQYFQVKDDGSITSQIRRYKKEDDANAFIEKLPQRGVGECKKKIIKSIKIGGKENG